jgi:hypothetical protein
MATEPSDAPERLIVAKKENQRLKKRNFFSSYTNYLEVH